MEENVSGCFSEHSAYQWYIKFEVNGKRSVTKTFHITIQTLTVWTAIDRTLQ